MKEIRYIVDTTMRDGEQSPGIALAKEDKLKIARLLDDIGVYEIEAGTPALGELEEESIKEIIKNKRHARISVWSRMRAQDVRQSAACRPDIIHIGAPVSYVQIYSKLRKNKSWVMKNLLECVEIVKSREIEVTVGLEDASRSDIGFMLSLIKELNKAEVSAIRVADTVGTLTPGRTKELIETIRANTDMKIEIHVHNDLGMAVANSIVGAKAGAEYIDCTLFGIGERTGNCNFYELVRSADSIFKFSMNRKQIRQVEQLVYNELKGAM